MLSQSVKDFLQKLDQETLEKCLIARDMAISYEKYIDSQTTLLSDSAAVYDIGMSYISHNLKNKTTALMQCERELLDYHSYMGYQLLKEMGEKEEVCQMILFHHSLNPVMLEEIPKCLPEVMEKRKTLFCIDAYIGLTSKRPYRDGFSSYQACELIEKTSNKDKQFLEFVKEYFY